MIFANQELDIQTLSTVVSMLANYCRQLECLPWLGCSVSWCLSHWLLWFSCSVLTQSPAFQNLNIMFNLNPFMHKS